MCQGCVFFYRPSHKRHFALRSKKPNQSRRPGSEFLPCRQCLHRESIFRADVPGRVFRYTSRWGRGLYASGQAVKPCGIPYAGMGPDQMPSSLVKPVAATRSHSSSMRDRGSQSGKQLVDRIESPPGCSLRWHTTMPMGHQLEGIASHRPIITPREQLASPGAIKC